MCTNSHDSRRLAIQDMLRKTLKASGQAKVMSLLMLFRSMLTT